jgi:hypothetical protein
MLDPSTSILESVAAGRVIELMTTKLATEDKVVENKKESKVIEGNYVTTVTAKTESQEAGRDCSGLKFLPVIHLVHPMEAKVLLDSGCLKANVMTESYFNQLKNVMLLPSTDVVVPEGNVALVTLGKCSLQLSIPGRRLKPTLEFIVVRKLSSSFDLILGSPAWTQLNIRLKLDRGLVSILGQNILLEKENFKKVTKEIRTKQKTILLPGVKSKVPVIVDGDIFREFPDKYLPIVPSQSLMETQVLKTPAAMTRNELNYMLVDNLSEQSITLKKGALLGHVISEEIGANCFTLTLNDILEDEKNENEVVGSNMFIPEKDESLFTETFVQEKISSSCKHLSKAQMEELSDLVFSYKHMFVHNDSAYPTEISTKTKCYVPLKESNCMPLKLPPYRYSPKVKEFIKETLQGLEENGLVKKTTSPWSFPVVVAIRNDKYRFCIDYSKLSDKVIKDSYPLPRIEDTFDYLGNSKYFTVVDCGSGFWQLPVNEDDQEKLAFCTPFGVYSWNAMPFGYTNAPAIYQRAMNETLDDLLFSCALVYIDDIIIFSGTFENHLKDIRRVFAKLDQYNWKLKMKKCNFAQENIEYLGHVVSQGSITVLERNIEKLKKMKRPTNIKETQQFLGAINYYRRFIQGLSYITEPLLVNLRNKKEFIWNQEQEESFTKIVELISSEPILKIVDYEKPFILKTDASAVGYGGVLCQVHEEVEHPVHFFSGSFNPAQRRKWNHWHREAYAVISGIKRYEHYLRGKKFTVVTDNESLLTLIKPGTELTTHMIDRWRLYLSSFEYDIYIYDIVHRPGRTLVIEDYLSRSVNFYSLDLKQVNLVDEQLKDEDIQKLIQRVKQQTIILSEKLEKIYKENKENLVVENDTLYYATTKKKKTKNNLKRIVVPEKFVQAIIEENHDHPSGGHLATEKLFYRISKRFGFEICGLE